MPVLPFCLVDLVCYRSHQDVGCNLPSCRACAPLCTGNDTHATGPGRHSTAVPPYPQSDSTPRSVTHHTHIRSQCCTTARHSHTHLRLSSGIWAGGFSKQRCSSAARAPLTARAPTRESEAARSRRLGLIALNIPPSRLQAGWDFDAGALPYGPNRSASPLLPRAAHAAGDPWQVCMLHVAGAHVACAACGMRSMWHALHVACAACGMRCVWHALRVACAAPGRSRPRGGSRARGGWRPPPAGAAAGSILGCAPAAAPPPGNARRRRRRAAVEVSGAMRGEGRGRRSGSSGLRVVLRSGRAPSRSFTFRAPQAMVTITFLEPHSRTPVSCACRRENFAMFRCHNANSSTISTTLTVSHEHGASKQNKQRAQQ